MQIVALSPKYQVVIPKEARKLLGITKTTRRIVIKSVTKDEIIMASAPSTEDTLLQLLHTTPATNTNAVARVRKLRDEWDK